MDPFSITVGIVGLVDGGISLSKQLKGKIGDFKNAEREVMDLAHEIDLCTTLLEVFGQSLDRPENAYPKNVVKQTKRLKEDMERIFEDVRQIILQFDASMKASAKYVVNAEALRGQHSNLKGLQLSFIFMLSVCPPQHMTTQTGPPPGAASVGNTSLAGLGSFEGTIQHVPIYSTDKGTPNGQPVTYQATLTLRPSTAGQALPGAPQVPAPVAANEPDFTDQLDELRKNRRLKKKLANLTSNPFFSKDMFGDMLSGLRSKPSTRMYGDAERISIEPRRAMTRQEKEELRWREEAELKARRNYEYENRKYEYEKRRKDDYVEAVPYSYTVDLGDSGTGEEDSDVDDILTYLFDDGKHEDTDDRDVDDMAETLDVDVGEPDATDYRSPATPSMEQPTARAPPPPVAVRPSPSQSGKQRTPTEPSMQSDPSLPPSSGSASNSKPPRTGYAPARSSRGYNCDYCGRKMRDMTCYHCKDCDDFDFCEWCFKNPDRTLRHPHGKNRFVAIET